MLKEHFPESEIRLGRTPYTGDYILKSYNFGNYYPWVPIAKFGMLPMPGCRAICILHHAEVEKSLRGKGIGTELLRIRLEVAKQMYKGVICTVRTDNVTEVNLLAKNGVNMIASYVNDKKMCIHVRWREL